MKLLVAPTFFLRLVVSLGVRYQPIVEKRLPWCQSSRSESLTSGRCFYLLTCTRPERVMQDSTSRGICLKTRLLPGSSCLKRNYTELTLNVSALWTTVELGMTSLPINKISSSFRALWFFRCWKLLQSSLCWRPSQVKFYSKYFWCQFHIHRCCKFVGNQGPYIYRWRLGSKSSLCTWGGKPTGDCYLCEVHASLDSRTNDCCLGAVLGFSDLFWRCIAPALDEFGAVPEAAWFRLSSDIDIRTISTIFLLYWGSPRLCGREQCISLQHQLLHFCSVKIVAWYHRGSRGCVCSQGVIDVVRRVYYECPLHMLSMFCLGVCTLPTLLLTSLSVINKIIFSTRANFFWKVKFLLARHLFGLMHQHSLNVFLPFSSEL